jgi:hypothetical protein
MAVNLSTLQQENSVRHVHRQMTESSEPKVRDEIPFQLWYKKKYFLTGLNEIYLPM